jgi:hypothetical protein
VYAALFTRDLKYEKHADDLGGYKNAVFAAESKISPILEVPAGTSLKFSAYERGYDEVTGMPIVEVSDRVTTTSGTTYSGTIYASNIFGMSYFQLLPNGDKIHSSSSLYTNRAPISLFDGITSNWNNAWHGLSGDTTMYALYEFVNSQAKSVSIMNFGQIPDTSGHYAGVINIYYWNGSSYEEVTYTSGHEFVSTTPGQVITVSFDRVKSLHFKIQVNRHITNTTPYVGLSLWTLKNDPNGPATPNPIVLDKAIDTNGDLVDLYTVNTGYLYVWAKTLGASDFAGGRSAIQGVVIITEPQQMNMRSTIDSPPPTSRTYDNTSAILNDGFYGYSGYYHNLQNGISGIIGEPGVVHRVHSIKDYSKNNARNLFNADTATTTNVYGITGTSPAYGTSWHNDSGPGSVAYEFDKPTLINSMKFVQGGESHGVDQITIFYWNSDTVDWTQDNWVNVVNPSSTGFGPTLNIWEELEITFDTVQSIAFKIDVTMTSGAAVAMLQGWSLQYVAAPSAKNVLYLTNDPALNELTGYATLNQSTKDSIGTGWTQIKYLPGDSTTWFPGDDNLLGYGGSEFLFTRGDFSAWLICEQKQVNLEYYDGIGRTITKSSISPDPYTAIWYYRAAAATSDPWVSLEDHSTSFANDTIMYAEASSQAATSSIHSSGMYVYIR